MENTSKKNTIHEYTTTKHFHHAVLFRVSNYFVLLSMLGLDHVMRITFSDNAYLLVLSAIVGYDVREFFTSFIKNKWSN